MLPRATHSRSAREAARGKQSGRTLEIQRLIGRSLRAVVDLKKLGQRTLNIDCDVLQADGGTRTASITGACVAAAIAFNRLLEKGRITQQPLKKKVAAISVGLVEGQPRLDLDYDEDVRAGVDMNVVMSSEGRFVEVQGTGEHGTFARDELDALLSIAVRGIETLDAMQDQLLRGPLPLPR